MPAIVLFNRRWHTSSDMICIPAGLGAFFHGIWVIIVAAESAHFDAWHVCPGSGPVYDVALGGLLAVFCMSAVNQTIMTLISLRGAPLELRKRRWVVPALYMQVVLWFATCGFLVLGTILISRPPEMAACWQGAQRTGVLHLLQAMVISTWVFAVMFLFVAFIVYNAYPNRGESNTWEQRVKCVSYLFGCYKSVVRQVEGRTTPLTSIAQWLAALFGDADLTPSDMSAAIVLTMAAQHRRRRLRIRRALQRSSAILQSEAERGEASSSENGGSSSDEEKPQAARKQRLALRRRKADNAQAANGSMQRSPFGSPAAQDPARSASVPLPHGEADGIPNPKKADAPSPRDGGGRIAEDRAASRAVAAAAGAAGGESHPASSASGALRKSMDNTASGFLMQRQISSRFPTVITPSEQAVEVAEEVDGVDEGDAHKHYLDQLDTVPYALLEEAREYARFATAVYCVQPFRDPDEPDPPPGPRPCTACGRDTRSSASHAGTSGVETVTGGPRGAQSSSSHSGGVRGTKSDSGPGRRQSGGPADGEGTGPDAFGMGPGADGHGDAAEKEPARVDTSGKGERVGCCGGCAERGTVPSEAAVRASIAEIGHLEPGDVMHMSPSNEVLAHLPYMVALHRKRRAVVVAIRGTSSLADLVTDAVVHPEAIDDWLPEGRDQNKGVAGRAYGHAGIVAAASALLIDLEEAGVLSGLLRSEEERREAVEEGAQEGLAVDGSNRSDTPNGGTPACGSPAGSSELGTAEGAIAAQSTGGGDGAAVADGPHERDGARNRRLTSDLSKKTGRDRVSDVAETGAADTKGEAVGTVIQRNVDTKGWDLVLTGHSLGAGAAALIALKLRSRFPDLRCWAFSPPGGLVSKGLQPAMAGWCTSVVAGKDAVPRASTNNLRRLMDEMITALARSRYHKLRVLLGGWWRKENRPPSDRLFRPYKELPPEARDFLVKYYRSVERRQKDIAMYPPGRVVFLRPLKMPKKRGPVRRIEKRWDAVWVTPEQLMAEGILISKKMLEDHLIQSTVLDAMRDALAAHPERAPEASAKPGRRERRELKRTAQKERRTHEAIVRGRGGGVGATRRGSIDMRPGAAPGAWRAGSMAV
ncbi:hypothetical protein WJX81_008445 [Elliptochloris bilobata]|uniref:sn-1-specific diacylglycerol lipase n=1 Tax=Elliptochloris bilobata TaxID=381761 RepID=A0AAW1QJQ4_9CHLO